MPDIQMIVSMLGIHPDAVAIGLMGSGLRATAMDQLDNRKKTASAILLSALTAGLFAAPVASFIHIRYPELGQDSIRLPIALIIGIFTPAAVRYGLAFLKRKEGEKP
jgi:hypothetical protein